MMGNRFYWKPALFRKQEESLLQTDSIIPAIQELGFLYSVKSPVEVLFFVHWIVPLFLDYSSQTFRLHFANP